MVVKSHAQRVLPRRTIDQAAWLHHHRPHAGIPQHSLGVQLPKQDWAASEGWRSGRGGAGGGHEHGAERRHRCPCPPARRQSRHLLLDPKELNGFHLRLSHAEGGAGHDGYRVKVARRLEQRGDVGHVAHVDALARVASYAAQHFAPRTSATRMSDCSSLYNSEPVRPVAPVTSTRTPPSGRAAVAPALQPRSRMAQHIASRPRVSFPGPFGSVGEAALSAVGEMLVCCVGGAVAVGVVRAPTARMCFPPPPRPQLCVLDLDMCVWRPEMYTLWGKAARLAAVRCAQL
eukprot:scaffold3186_cov125-Isochrysis_galbana.AAC.4